MGTSSAVKFGERLESQGTMPTDRLFTGQKLDNTGLYYYGARYYDPSIGRFISPDTFVQSSTGFAMVSSALTVNVIRLSLKGSTVPTPLAPLNPQALNRYSYVINNPLKYTDPTGEFWPVFFVVLEWVGLALGVGYCALPIWQQERSPVKPDTTPEPSHPEPTEPPTLIQTDTMTPSLPLGNSPDDLGPVPTGPTWEAVPDDHVPPGTVTIGPATGSTSGSGDDSSSNSFWEWINQMLNELDGLGWVY